MQCPVKPLIRACIIDWAVESLFDGINVNGKLLTLHTSLETIELLD